MLKRLGSNKKRGGQNNKGFTLVELVIVIAILAILVGLLAPQYTKYVEKSRKSADVDNLEEMVKAFQVVCTDMNGAGITAGTFTITLDKSGAKILKGESTSMGSAATAVAEFLGDGWTNTKLKSANWSGNAITATCEISSEGAMTVTYCDDVKSYVSSGEVTTSTTE